MSNIRRYYIPNAIVFVTSVTNKRERIFLKRQSNELLLTTIESVRKEKYFELMAFVILPDHFHFLIKMPDETNNFSKILQLIKGRFTNNFKISQGITDSISIWQKRFWDHIIRSEQDLKNHLDYIHWNPLKHGLVDEPEKWFWSSYSNWIKLGLYENGWGRFEKPVNIQNMNFE